MINIVSQSGHAAHGVIEFVMSAITDVADLPVNNILAGSTAFCTANSKTYIFDGNRWQEILVDYTELPISVLKDGDVSGSLAMAKIPIIDRDLPTDGNWIVAAGSTIVKKTSQEIINENLIGYAKQDNVYKKNNKGTITPVTLTEIQTELTNDPQASNIGAMAIGIGTQASGEGSFATGYLTNAQAYASHAENHKTTASGSKSHAEGGGTTASGTCAHSEGDSTVAQGAGSHAEGGYTFATGDYSHAEGAGNNYNGADQKVLASGVAAHAEGFNTTASGNYSHAEGGRITGDSYGPKATGVCSHAEGRQTNALEEAAHSEGVYTNAKKKASHAEGLQTTADAQAAHAEGEKTKATGRGAHAEGYAVLLADATTASGVASHAGGTSSVASNTNSFAHGDHVTAAGANETVFGQYNDENYTVGGNSPLFSIGNGINSETKSTAFAIGQNGDTDINGDINVSGKVQLQNSGSQIKFGNVCQILSAFNKDVGKKYDLRVESENAIRIRPNGKAKGIVIKCTGNGAGQSAIAPEQSNTSTDATNYRLDLGMSGYRFKTLYCNAVNIIDTDGNEYLVIPKPTASDGDKVLTAHSDGTVTWESLT